MSPNVCFKSQWLVHTNKLCSFHDKPIAADVIIFRIWTSTPLGGYFPFLAIAASMTNTLMHQLWL